LKKIKEAIEFLESYVFLEQADLNKRKNLLFK